MNEVKVLFVIVLTMLLGMISACGIVPVNSSLQPKVVVTGKKIDLNQSAQVKGSLYQQYSQWKGVRYKTGGLSKRGIDCSGFVRLTYASKLGVVIPRSTASQSKVGFRIKKSELRAGDLVFFKTGINVRHVGMYLEGGKFLHASSSKGVTISKLSNDYWARKYWQARRIR